MPMRMPWSSANWISGGHTSLKRGQFSSIDRVQSRPMKVLTTPTPNSSAARMTFLIWAMETAASSASGARGLG